MTQSINESRIVKAEIITPLHVGDASEKLLKRGIDYFYLDENLYFVKFNDLLKAASEKNVRMDTISNLLASNNSNELQKYLFTTLKLDIRELSYNIIENYGENPGNEIRPLIQTNGKPFIPGSSIKGAIRSILFNYLYYKVDERDLGVDDYQLERALLGNFDQSIMRFIRVSDSDTLTFGDTGVFKIELFNLYAKTKNWASDWKENFKIFAECFYPETKIQFKLSLASNLVKALENKYVSSEQLPKNIKAVFSDNTFETLTLIINNYTRKHLELEIEFFKKFNQANDSELIIAQLENLLIHTIDTKSCLMRMAYGSGFYGITGDWRFRDHIETIFEPDQKNWVYSRTVGGKEPAHYKSRRIAGNDLLGFIKLTF